MKISRLIIVIIASPLFMPVSCTMGLVAGINVIAWYDSRDVSKGDPVHSPFSVVAIPRDSTNINNLTVLSLQDIEMTEKQNENISFIMPLPGSSLETDSCRYTYKVLVDNKIDQVIEVVETYKDGDKTIWSKYMATRNEVYPLSSKMFYFGYMFSAIPIGILLSICLYVSGRILAKRSKLLKKQKNKS